MPIRMADMVRLIEYDINESGPFVLDVFYGAFCRRLVLGAFRNVFLVA